MFVKCVYESSIGNAPITRLAVITGSTVTNNFASPNNCYTRGHQCATGESGGGNLCISSAMKAASEGVKVDGVYASCPLISNCYDETTPGYGKRFPSIVENEGYVLSFLHLTGRLYTEVGSPGARDGFAWPIHATDEQLRLLPKTIISRNELDTLRDEGIALLQRLTKLGNEGYYTEVKGTVHPTEVSLPAEVPAIRNGMLDGIASFTRSL